MGFLRRLLGIVPGLVFVVIWVAACSGGAATSPPASASASAPASAPAVVVYDHLPGTSDVSTMERGVAFRARPNFHFFEGCGRPCRMPLYPQRQLITGTAATSDWPCEARSVASRAQGPFCSNSDDAAGDWVDVICQVTGAVIRNEAGQTSDVWDVFDVPKAHLAADVNLSGLKPGAKAGTYRLYGPDLWFGDTSRDPTTQQATLARHALPC